MTYNVFGGMLSLTQSIYAGDSQQVTDKGFDIAAALTNRETYG